MYALIIGISKYMDASFQPLKYADKDAQLIADVLRSQAGVNDQDVVVLTNQQATRAAIDDAFKNFVTAHAKTSNSLVFFIAGHSLENERKEDFVVAYNTNHQDPKTTGYSFDEFRSLLAKQAEHYGKVLAFADICHGELLEGAQGEGKAQRAVDRAFKGLGGEYALLVASDNGFAFESQKFGEGHGAFSYFLAFGLGFPNGTDSEHGPNSIRSDVLNWRDLKAFVSGKVSDYTLHQQQPRALESRSRTEITVWNHVEPAGIAFAPPVSLTPEEVQNIKNSQNRDTKRLTKSEQETCDNAGGAGDPIDIAICKGALLPGQTGSAYSIVIRLRPGSDERKNGERRLKVALSNKAQEIIFRYLEGEQIPQRQEDFELCSNLLHTFETLDSTAVLERGLGLFCDGRAATFAGDYDRAERLLNQSIQSDPERAYAWNALGILRLERLNKTSAGALRRSDFDSAADAFRKAIQYAPYWAYPVHNLALTLSELGRYDEAIAMYQRSIKIGPPYPYLPYSLGLLLQQINRIKESEAYYAQAEIFARDAYFKRPDGTSPELSKAANALGTAVEHSSLDRAKASYREAIDADKNNIAPRYNLAVLLMNEVNHTHDRAKIEALDKEIAALWQANLALVPNHQLSLLEYGRFLAGQASRSDDPQLRAALLQLGVSQYRTLLGTASDFDVAHRELASILISIGEPEDALVEFHDIRNLLSVDTSLLDTMAHMLRQKGDTIRARESLSLAIASLPGHTNRKLRSHLEKEME